MRAFAVNHRLGAEIIQIDRGDRVDRVDKADRISAAALCSLGGFADIGDIGRQLDDAGHPAVLFDPAGDHFDIFRHLPHGRSHSPFCHPMRATKVQLHPIGLGVFDRPQDRFPAFLVARHHEGNHHRPVRIVALDGFDLAQVHLQGAVGDQLDVVEAQKPPVSPPDRAIARAVDVHHRRPFRAKGLPDNPAPACLKGAAHVIFFVRRRGRGQPERVGRFDSGKGRSEISHDVLPQPIRLL